MLRDLHVSPGLAGAEIQRLIDESDTDCRVVFASGDYSHLGSVILDRPAEIVGDGTGDEVHLSSVRVRSGDLRIRGLTIQGHAWDWFLHVENGARATLSGCRLRNSYGVAIATGSSLSFLDCEFTDNLGESDSESVISAVGADASLTVERCRFIANRQRLLSFRDGARGLIRNCLFFGPGYVAVDVGRNCEPRIESCDISDFVIGVWVHGWPVHRWPRDDTIAMTLKDCRVVNASAAGVMVENHSAILEGCSITRCRVGVSIRDSGKSVLQNCNLADSTEAGISVDADCVCLLRRSEISSSRDEVVRAAPGATIEMS